MPANKYTRSLYKPGTVAAEIAAERNRDPARKAAAEKITREEGTTSPAGGRAVKMPPKPTAPKMQKVISMTTNMKSSPMGKKR